MLRSRRFAFVAATVIFGLSGCGDAARTTTPGSAPSVIHIGSGGTSTAGGARPEASSSDKMMMPFGGFEFIFDGTLPTLGDTAQAWQLPAGATVDTARVAQMAAVLGIVGDVRELPADQGGGWQVGSADYTGASLTVGADGMVSWWYNPDPSVYGTSSGGCVVGEVAIDPADTVGGTDSASPDTTVVSPPDTRPCEEPAPPANVPDQAAALAKAQQLITDLGFDPTGYEFDTYADEWGANVTGFLMVGGMRSPITISVGFGAEGVVTWMSGSMATPQPAGEYPLVGTQAGLDRLADGAWMGYYGAPGAMVKAASDVAVSDVATGGETAAPPDTGTGTDVVDTVLVDPVPVDPNCDPAADCVPETFLPPEPIEVHLTDAHLDLTMVWDVDGTVWLVPAYTFTSADGGAYTVIAVEDSLIDLPEPMPIETIDDGTVNTDTGSEPAGKIGGDVEVTIDIDMAKTVLVGVALDEATKVAADLGWTVRAVRIDGEDQIVTMDYLTNPVNVAVEAGVMTAVDSIG